MEIEGYLTKWTNYISGWKERYFALSNGILYYSSRKNSALKGQIHLKVSKISLNDQDPLGIIIDSGTKLLHLRAETISEKMKWLTALKSSKVEIQELDQSLNKIKHSNINPALLEEFIKKIEVHDENEEKLDFSQNVDNFLREIINQESKMDVCLTNLVKKVDFLKKDNEAFKMIENIVELASGCYNVFLEERKNILKKLKKIEKNQANEEQIKNDDLFCLGDFSQESFEFESKSLEEELKKEEKNLVISPSLIQENLISHMKFNEDYKKFLADLKNLDPSKYKILTENQVFKTRALPLPNHSSFILPPHKEDESHNLTSVVKSFFGKDFENLPIPSILYICLFVNSLKVQFHEPISILQRACEAFKNSELLDKANENSDSLIRLAYIVAFAFSLYSSTIDRTRKPFTPILGETFEFEDLKREFKFYAEQVNENCFASYCSGKGFEFWNDTKIKMVFWGKNMEFKPIGICNVTMKNHGDHFVFTRPTTSIENLLTNTPFVDNFGEMTFKNLTTNETAQLTLKKRGFNNKNAFEAEGFINEKSGNPFYTIKGKWNSYLSITNQQQQELFLWKCDTDSQNSNPYFFSDFTKELNNLNQENVLKLPLSDSRFRTDQKALEYGMLDLAIEEHSKIKNAEILRKKRGETEKLQSKWFEKIDLNGESCFIFQNNLRK